MFTTSALFLSKIKEPTRTLDIKVLVGSITLTGTEIQDLEIEYSSGNDNLPSIGGVTASTLKLTLINIGNTPTVYTTQAIKPYVRLADVDDWIPLGTFYPEVDSIVKTNQTTKITCFDKIEQFEHIAYESNLTYPNNTHGIIAELMVKYNLEFETQTLPNVPIGIKLQGSIRSVLSELAELFTTNCFMNRDNKVTFRHYKKVAFSLTADNYIDFKTKSDKEIQITKLACKKADDGLLAYGSSIGSTLQFENDNVIKQADINNIYNRAYPFTYVGYELKLQGMPHLECGDIVTLTDNKNVVRELPIINHVLRFDGGLISQFSAGVPSANVTTVGSVGTNAITADIGKLQTNLLQVNELLAGNISADNIKANTIVAGSGIIADGAITRAKIQDAAISSAKIEDASITSAKIGNAQILNAHIGNGVINNANIANATIDSAKIKNGAITTALMDLQAVGSAQIADASITDAKIVELTANKIKSGTIDANTVNIKNLNAENITVGKLNGTQISDFTIKDNNIADNNITGKKLVENSITAREIAAESITANEIASNTITAANIASGTITSNEIKAGSITTNSLSSEVGSGLDISSNTSIMTRVTNETFNNNIDSINNTIEDINTTTSARIEHTETQLALTQEEIKLKATKEELDGLGNVIQENSASLTTLNNSFNFEISKINKNIDDTNEDMAEVKNNMTFDENGLTLGKTNNPFQITVDNDSIDFKDNGQVVAYINGQKMYIDKAEILNSLIVGVHQIEKYNNDVTLLRWIG